MCWTATLGCPSSKAQQLPVATMILSCRAQQDRPKDDPKQSKHPYPSLLTQSLIRSFHPEGSIILGKLCWGGELNELLATRLRMNGRRRHAAFGFKGPGQGGNLTPKKMGKNGNRIPRLFRSPAEVFFTQYWGPVDESVYHLMHELAQAKSASEGSTIDYGVIDGTDPQALMQAYPRFFACGR
ncbi:MAG: hypothetical protein WCA20_21815 [Candidatus Sulfotelmatobacter sp.]